MRVLMGVGSDASGALSLVNRLLKLRYIGFGGRFTIFRKGSSWDAKTAGSVSFPTVDALSCGAWLFFLEEVHVALGEWYGDVLFVEA